LPELYELISIFGYLKEILVVEKQVGWVLRDRERICGGMWSAMVSMLRQSRHEF